MRNVPALEEVRQIFGGRRAIRPIGQRVRVKRRRHEHRAVVIVGALVADDVGQRGGRQGVPTSRRGIIVQFLRQVLLPGPQTELNLERFEHVGDGKEHPQVVNQKQAQKATGCCPKQGRLFSHPLVIAIGGGQRQKRRERDQKAKDGP